MNATQRQEFRKYARRRAKLIIDLIPQMSPLLSDIEALSDEELQEYVVTQKKLESKVDSLLEFLRQHPAGLSL